MIQKLSQFKKAIGAGKRFEIVEHFVKPEHTGEIRKPNVIQTNAFYSVVDGEPENEVSLANGGKGFFMRMKKPTATNLTVKQSYANSTMVSLV